jgi:hypothetical protein
MSGPGPVNPDVTRTPGVQPSPGTEGPRIGGQDDASRADKFNLPKGQEVEKGPETQEGGKVTAFDLANQKQGGGAQAMPIEEMEEKLQQLSGHFDKIKGDIQNPSKIQGITPDHLEAMNRVMEKMNPDMRTIAKNTGGEFKPPEKPEGQSPLDSVMQWVNGGQDTLSGALNHLSTMDQPDMGTYMKLQYSVQRATQRGELFASIIGSTVSGIKTIMSTQLG